MHSFLEFLTTVLFVLSIAIVVSTIVTFISLFFVDKRRIKHHSPAILLWSMLSGTTVLIITLVLIATGVLPDISILNMNVVIEHLEKFSGN